MAGVAGFNLILHTPLTGESNKELNKAANNLVKTAIQQGDAENANNLMGAIEYSKQIRSGAAIHVVFCSDPPPSAEAMATIERKLQAIGVVFAATT